MSYALAKEADFVEAESSLTDRYQTTVPEAIRRFLKNDGNSPALAGFICITPSR